MRGQPISVETVGDPDRLQSPGREQPWYKDFSATRAGKGPHEHGLHHLINPLLARFLDLALVHRGKTFAKLAEGESDPLTEYHHHLYCQPWGAGRDQMDYLLRRGLRPGHRVLDFGCGAMRTGVWLARYLNAGNYFGIDAHRPSLDVAAQYEIPLHGLEEKRPRLLHDANARVDHFGVRFDLVLLLAVMIHLTREQRSLILGRIAANLASDGRIVIWRAPEDLTDEWLRRTQNLTIVHREAARGRIVKVETDWTELRSMGPD